MAIELTNATAEQISGIQDALNLDIPVLTDYPTTDATKVGQKFVYKGNEWKYHSQAELDDLGWTTVSEGFPAPVSKQYDPYKFYKDANISNFEDLKNLVAGSMLSFSGLYNYEGEIDFLGIGRPEQFQYVITSSSPDSIIKFSSVITKFRNSELLLNLEDYGTQECLDLNLIGLTDVVINDLFNQLPQTTKTCTINVTSNPGSATCDPTIATAKGYTVVT